MDFNLAKKNYLLASLGDEELKRIVTNSEIVSLELGEAIYESGDRIDYAYFPATAVISMLYIMENGSTAEIGIVGNDGMLGISQILDGDSTTSRAVIQGAGDALRLRPADVGAEFSRAGRIQDFLLRYTQALMTQISQTAVCNRLHAVDQ